MWPGVELSFQAANLLGCGMPSACELAVKHASQWMLILLFLEHCNDDVQTFWRNGMQFITGVTSAVQSL